MGTRGTLHIQDGKKTLASLYFQYDTYPTGLGDELVSLLKDSIVCNGYSMGMASPKHFNGIGCLGAYLIKHFKAGIGHHYLTSKTDRQEYNYFISVLGFSVYLKLKTESGKILFSGPIENFVGKGLE